MATDGDMDYSGLTAAQIDDALSNIDKVAYPLNHQRLLAEQARRQPAVAAKPPASVLNIDFDADPKEYFRIWIVNLALTILTIGIYSAWAKVRKQRYLYGSSSLAGSSFQYHGQPLAILKGRLIAAALVGSYFLASRFSIVATIIVVALFLLATPWLLVKSRMFATRMTSWRGVRFNFDADYAGAYRTILGWGLAGIVSLGTLMPLAIRARYAFVISRTRFGTVNFNCAPTGGRFYKTAFASAGMSIALILPPLFLLGYFLAPLAKQDKATFQIVFQVATLLLYAVIFSVVGAYVSARNMNEVFNHTALGPHRFCSSLSATALAKIYLANTLLMVMTLGLYTPWAQLRVLRYRLQSLALQVEGSIDNVVMAAGVANADPTGGEVLDMLGVDFGL